MYTLRFFGLPRGYLEGEGHFADWAKKRLEEKKRGPKTKKEKKKAGKAVSLYKKKLGREKKEDSDVKPTYFDITVFLTDMQRDFHTFNRIYREHFEGIDPECRPCRTTVEVGALPTPIAVELKCVAHLKG